MGKGNRNNLKRSQESIENAEKYLAREKSKAKKSKFDKLIAVAVIALVAVIGIAFLTGKGLGLLYIDQEPMTEEEVEEYTSHTNPVHMCRFIGICILLGCVVAILLTVGLMTNSKVVNIVAICFAVASVIGALISYIVIFKYRPMKRRYLAEKKAMEEAAAKAAKSKKRSKTAETKQPTVAKETKTSKRVKAVRAISNR